MSLFDEDFNELNFDHFLTELFAQHPVSGKRMDLKEFHHKLLNDSGFREKISDWMRACRLIREWNN